MAAEVRASPLRAAKWAHDQFGLETPRSKGVVIPYHKESREMPSLSPSSARLRFDLPAVPIGKSRLVGECVKIMRRTRGARCLNATKLLRAAFG